MIPRFFAALRMTIMLLVITGCATKPNPIHASAAKTLFEATVRNYHFPSATATGKERNRLLTEAAAGYERILHDYPDQNAWCAKSLRSLGNVRAEQGRLNDAIGLYRRVGDEYRQNDWEVLQAWKSAGDLLWDNSRQVEARKFYRQIITHFDHPDAALVVQTIVRAAKWRLAPVNATS